MRVEVLGEGGAGEPERDGPVARDAVGAAGAGQRVAELGAVLGHRGQHGGEGGDGVAPAGRGGHAAGELGGGLALLIGHGDRVRRVVAVGQLVLVSGEVVLAVAPGCPGVGAIAGAARRGPGEGLQVAPVHGQGRAGVLELLRDAGLQQVAAGALQFRRRQPVRLVLARRGRHQAEGALGLPVGQRVRAVLPVRRRAAAAPGRL